MNEPETEKVTTSQESGSAEATAKSEEALAAATDESTAEAAVDETETEQTEGTEGLTASDNRELKWYVATTYSGFENKVKTALAERIRQHHAEDKFGEILIPSESVTEQTKTGKTRVKSKTSFPGYVFVQMLMNENTWHLVKDTPKVTGFIGNQRPQEVKPPHIEDLRRGITEGAVKPKPRHRFQEGDEVRVVVGAFANFSGTVQEVKPDKQKLKVMVSIFGRPTPVELDFSHVEKR